jgi:iron-sulfur cluster repair protein YtfE (RIC family)
MPIKRHKSLQPLSRDHHQALILSQQLKKGAPQYKGMPSTLEGKKNYALSFYNGELVQHFKDEEEILFPLGKNKSSDLDTMISDIIFEHRRMESLINEIENATNLEELLDELGQLLEKHIRKEERELFVEIENILSDDELNIIGEKLGPS